MTKTIHIVKNLLRRIEQLDEIIFRKNCEKEILSKKLDDFIVEEADDLP